MENMSKQNSSLSAALLSVVVLAAGAILLGYSLHMLPEAPAYGFPWAFAGVVVALLPVIIGSGLLGGLGRRNDGMPYGQRGTAVQIGVLVIIVGVVLLCFNFDVLPVVWRRVLFSWQMLLILAGINELSQRHIIGGGVLLAIGTFFVVKRLAPIYPDIAASAVGTTYWPVLLIILGVLILIGFIFRPRNCPSRRRNHSGRDGRREISGTPATASGIVDVKVVFGGNEQVYLDPEFKGGQISCVFGGVMLDLRRTELPEGETFLKVEAVFGGVEIYAPEGWNIIIRNESVFGGFVDKRFRSGEKYDDGRRLIIRASNVFGGGEVK